MASKYDVVGIPQTVKVLRSIDKQIVNDARKDLRTGVQPVVNAIKTNIPSQAPLRGMIHNGRTGWNSAGVPVKTKTDFSKRAQKNESSLVSIIVGGKVVVVGAIIFDATPEEFKVLLFLIMIKK